MKILMKYDVYIVAHVLSFNIGKIGSEDKVYFCFSFFVILFVPRFLLND